MYYYYSQLWKVNFNIKYQRYVKKYFKIQVLTDLNTPFYYFSTFIWYILFKFFSAWKYSPNTYFCTESFWGVQCCSYNSMAITPQLTWLSVRFVHNFEFLLLRQFRTLNLLCCGQDISGELVLLWRNMVEDVVAAVYLSTSLQLGIQFCSFHNAGLANIQLLFKFSWAVIDI